MSKTLLITTRTILTIIGLVIIIDCVALMAVGKINFGSVVPFLVGSVFVAHGLFWQAIRRFFSRNPWLNRLWYALWGIFVLWLISFVIFI
ncbi:MAG: YdcF family protein, partial [Psychrobacter sp.]